jgi:TP901 family phage tail tape measure protein
MVGEGEVARFYATIDANIGGLQRGVAQARAEMGTLGASATGAASTARGAFAGIGGTIALGLGVGAVAGVSGAFKSAVGNVISYETAFTGVRRTVEGSDAEFATLDATLRRFATETLPVGREELAKIATIGGQAGLAIADIPNFVDTVVRTSVSTNGVLGIEEAATALARLRGPGLLNMPIDQLDELGSAILKVGDESEANEQEIVDHLMRIAASGKLVGITTAELIGLAATLPSLGIEAELAGTAISQTWQKLQGFVNSKGSGLEDLGKLTGLGGEGFAKMWDENPGEAFALFLEGLKASGDDAIGILKDFEINGARATDTLLRLAQDTNGWREQSAYANEELRTGLKIIEDSGAAFGTTASEVEIFKNNVVELGDAAAGPLVSGLNEALPSLTEFVRLLGRGAELQLIPDAANLFNKNKDTDEMSQADRNRLQDALRGRLPTSEGTEYDQGIGRLSPSDIGGAFNRRNWEETEGALDSGAFLRRERQRDRGRESRRARRCRCERGHRRREPHRLPD